MKKVVIVGGGASGLVCSIVSKNSNNEVIILEKNSECGVKLLSTGNGKCNYFNDNQSISNYYSNSKSQLEKIITEENIDKVKSFYSSLGLVPKISNGYYYPNSLQASSFRNILLRRALEKNVRIKYNFKVEEVIKKDNKFIIKSEKEEITADKVIISTASYSGVKNTNTNSYDILNGLGLKIETVLPSLVQVKTDGNFLKKWDGVRSDVCIKLFENNNIIKEEKGQIQLTNYGISGICTFNISGYVSRGLYKNNSLHVSIDFLPNIELNLAYLDKRNKLFKEINIYDFFEGLINNKLIKVILDRSGIDSNKKYDELTNNEKQTLINNIKNFKLKVIGTLEYSRSQTCTGGLSLEEINPNTMEVNKIKGLYVIGELLDVDGLCGGYNLTFATLSGILSGSDIND